MVAKNFTRSSGTNSTTNNWDVAANWSSSGEPTSADDATVGLAGTYTAFVTTAGNAANSLVVGNAAGTAIATFAINTGGVLVVTGLVNVMSGATLTLGGGSLTAGSLTFRGNSGGTNALGITGTNSQLEIKTSLSVLNAAGSGPGTLTLTGAGATLSLDDSQTLNNVNINLGATAGNNATLQQKDSSGTNGTLTLGSGVTITHLNNKAAIAGANVVNQGVINASKSGGDLLITATHFTNQGTINSSNNDSVTIGGAATTFSNTGTIDILTNADVTVSAGTFTNQASGLIKIESTGQAFLGLSGHTWSNLGTIQLLSGGELHLDGVFTLASLGTVTNSGGTVFIAGSFDNTGHSLNNTDFFGAAKLDGGTVHGGITTTAGLLFTNNGGVLDGVTYRGAMNLSGTNVTVTIDNGLTATDSAGTGPGTITLTGNGAEMDFEGNQTLDNVTIEIGNNGGNGSTLAALATAPGDTLTLGTGVLIQQTIGNNATLGGDNIVNKGTITASKAGGDFEISLSGNFTNQGTINAAAAASASGSAQLGITAANFVNQGLIDVANTDTLTMSAGSFTNAAGAIIRIETGSTAFVGANGVWTNSGLIDLKSGGFLHLQGEFTLAALGTVNNAGGTVFINGTLDNTGNVLDGSSFLGQAQLVGGIIHSGIVKPAGLLIQSGTLDAVTYQGDLNLTSSGQKVTIINGLTSENAAGTGPGTINVTAQSASITFDDTETFDNATVNLGTATGTARLLAGASGNSSAVVTLGPNAIVHHVGINAGLGGDGTLINQGSIIADFAGGNLQISMGTLFTPSTFTNQGTISVSNGDTVTISNSTIFTNLSGTTLTGGHYQVGANSKIQLASDTQIQTLNADLTLSGAGSVVQGLDTGTSTQVTLESSLTAIGPDGELHLLGGRNFTATHAVTDSGLIELAGTTFGALSLSIDATGDLMGFGAVAAALTNAGNVEATGILTLAAVDNTGDMLIDTGANLVLNGAVAGAGLITFGTGAQILSVANAAFQSNNLSNIINDFGTGDKIDLTGISDATHADFDYSTNTLTVSGGAGGPFTFHFDPSESFSGDFFHLGTDGNGGLYITEDSNPCYCRGTMILTERGERAVEDLEIGDLVMTGAGRLRPIKWIGRRSFSGRYILGRKDLLPICFKAGSLDGSLPQRDLWISPHHAMYLEGVLIEAKDLVNGVSIVQAAKVDQVEYFHIELDSHDLIVAEGALSESFIDDDNRMMFHNAHEYAVLYPNELTARPVYCAARREDGDEVETARRRIDALAGLTTREGAPAVRGFVDAIGPDAVAGWVWLEGRPERQVAVDVFAAGRFVGSVMANRYRGDLAEAGIGLGTHGFVLPLSGNIDPATLTVRCTIADATLPLSRYGQASLAEAQRIAA